MRLDVLCGPDDGGRIDVALKVAGGGASMTVRHSESMAYGGLLRQVLARALVEITGRYRVTLVAFLAVPPPPAAKEGKNVVQAERDCQLCVTVYGAREAGRYVGDILDQAGIYLQHPTSYDSTVPYINPHYLVRPGGSAPVITFEEQAALPTRPSMALSTDQRLKGDVLQVIDSSAQGPSSYSEITPSSRMRTTLKL